MDGFNFPSASPECIYQSIVVCGKFQVGQRLSNVHARLQLVTSSFVCAALCGRQSWVSGSFSRTRLLVVFFALCVCVQ